MYNGIGNSEVYKQNLITGKELVKFYNKQNFLVAIWKKALFI